MLVGFTPNSMYVILCITVIICVMFEYSFSALQPSDVTTFFEPIFQQAKELRKAYSRFSSLTKVPFITVSYWSLNF